MLVYVLSGTLAAAVVGFMLGIIGSQIGVHVVSSALALFGVIAIALGGIETFGHRLRPVQLDRETPYDWLREGPLRWAMKNGAALGVGATTRLGFWLWYVVPIGALCVASPVWGAIGFASYGFTRTIGAAGLLLLERKRGTVANEIQYQAKLAQGLAGFQLLCVGIAVAVVAGI